MENAHLSLLKEEGLKDVLWASDVFQGIIEEWYRKHEFPRLSELFDIPKWHFRFLGCKFKGTSRLERIRVLYKVGTYSSGFKYVETPYYEIDYLLSHVKNGTVSQYPDRDSKFIFNWKNPKHLKYKRSDVLAAYRHLKGHTLAKSRISQLKGNYLAHIVLKKVYDMRAGQWTYIGEGGHRTTLLSDRGGIDGGSGFDGNFKWHLMKTNPGDIFHFKGTFERLTAEEIRELNDKSPKYWEIIEQ